MALVQIAADDFNRADGPIGSNWLYIRPTNFTSTPAVSLNQLRSVSAYGTNNQVCRWAGAGTFTADQYASFVIGDAGEFQAIDYRVGCAVRCDDKLDSQSSYYEMYVASDNPPGSVRTLALAKRVNGSRTVLFSSKTLTWPQGTQGRLEVVGTTLNAYRNDVLVATIEDTSIATGVPGVAVGGLAVIKIDSWAAGNVTSGTGASIFLSPSSQSKQVGSPGTVAINRSAAAPTGGVTYNLTSSNPAVATVPATGSMAAAASTSNVTVTPVSAGTVTITATNAADSNETATATFTVSAATVKKLKLLAHIDALGATAVSGDVHKDSDGSFVGRFTGAAFGTVAEAGEAALKVDASAFSGGSLTTSDALRVSWAGTSAAGSALGATVPIGSVGEFHTATVIEE